MADTGFWLPGGDEQQNRHVKKSTLHSAWHEKLTNADRLASTILATIYSHSRAAASQSKIGFDCVAVGIVGLSSESTFYVAVNGISLSHLTSNEEIRLSIINVMKEGCLSGVIVPVDCPSQGMHAEMQILHYLSARGFDVPKCSVVMGVSKPCCFQCATILRHSNVAFSLYHTDKVENWDAPTLKWL
ncbi:MAG TPA: hypothetical protein VHD76_08775 [Bryobacteraceae bacterium]|nr:hypothetical protein [Bryobacteraceae bacterium]